MTNSEIYSSEEIAATALPANFTPFRFLSNYPNGEERQDLTVHIGEVAEACLRRATREVALAEVTVLLSAICWFLQSIQGEGSVQVSIPSQPRSGSEVPALLTFTTEVNRLSSMRAHLKVTKDSLVEQLRQRQPSAVSVLSDVYVDSMAAHGELPLPDATLRLRYRGSGQLWLDAPAALGSSWLQTVSWALCSYLEKLASPDLRLSEIPWLNPEEHAHLHRLATGRQAPELLQGCIVTAFEQQVRQHPDQPAVIGAERQVTYAELNQAANRLGHCLRSTYGVCAGQVVGVLLDNDVNALVGMMAVLKVGGVYMPLEVEWPEARTSEVIAISGASMLITSSQHLRNSLAHVPTFAIDLQLRDLNEPCTDIFEVIKAEQTAYLCFTSGSTGRPKGVRVAHASLFNMLQDQVSFLHVTNTDRVLQPFSLAFDASLLSIGLAFLAGGAVVPLSRELLGDPGATVAYLQCSGTTIASFVPSMLRLLPPEALGSIHTIICGGEPLTLRDVKRYGSDRRLINSYGATETTCCVCAEQLEPDGDIVLGRSIANSTIHVLNSEGELLPVGVIGEICVGGAAVAQGYIGDDGPDVFSPSPFQSGDRLYRTGDLGFWRTDGRLQLIGRQDQQLKINGQRIEPGEVEAVLISHPAVQSAHVLGHCGQIWAFVAGQDLPAPERLLAFLADYLPHYMLPMRMIPVDSLPQSANGKVDTAALRSLISTEVAETLSVQTESVWEQRLSAIWQEVLGGALVSVTADFFEVGGNSLLALQVLARIEKDFGVRVSLSSFFQASSLRRLSTVVESAPPVATRHTAIPTVPERSHYDLSPTQLGMWLDCQLHPNAAAYNVPRVFSLDGQVDSEILRLAVEDLGQRHEALRTNFILEQGNPRQIIHPQPIAHLEIVDDLASPQQVEAKVNEICSTPFRLDRDPLLRVVLLHSSGASNLIVLAHHIICDGWSMSLLLQDLSHLYQARTTAMPPPDAPWVAHRSYTEWQIAQALSPAVQSQLIEWREHLKRINEKPLFVPDRPQPTQASAESDQITHRFSRDSLDQLRGFAVRRRSSPFQIVLAVLSCVLRQEFQEPHVIVGSPVSLRTRPELEEQIGLLLNMLVLCINTEDAETFLDVLDRTEAEVAWALERHECPYPLIVKELGRANAVRRNALFSVELDYRASTLQADPKFLQLGTTIAHRIRSDRSQGRKFAIDILFTEDENGLLLAVLFDLNLYQRSTVVQLVEQMKGLLTRVITGQNPALPRTLSRCDTALESRRRRLRHHLNASATRPDDGGLTIRELRSEQPICEYLAEERGRLEGLSKQGGAILYRGCGISSATDFHAALVALGEPLICYTERSSKRREVAPFVYTSTEHPADQTIRLHTEHSYAARWPLRIIFCCIHPAQHRGDTLIASVPQMMARLRPETLARFRDQGVLYVRNFGGGLGLDWQEVFGTSDRSEVEAYCRANHIQWIWGEKEHLSLRFQRPALRQHPTTGQDLWFNHAYFFNPASLDPQLRAAMRQHCATNDLPFQTFYGNGEEIPDSVIAEIESAYAAVEQRVSWQRGDLLILDNMMVAHGRQSYEGHRKVLVSMSGLYPPEAVTPKIEV